MIWDDKEIIDAQAEVIQLLAEENARLRRGIAGEERAYSSEHFEPLIERLKVLEKYESERNQG